MSDRKTTIEEEARYIAHLYDVRPSLERLARIEERLGVVYDAAGADARDKTEAAIARIANLADGLDRLHDGSIVTSDYPMIARQIRGALGQHS